MTALRDRPLAGAATRCARWARWCCCSARASSPAAPAIVAVRVWPADDYTRVTIESDAALAATHFLAENPPRLVIDIDGLELSPALRELVGKVRADDPFIAGVRVGQNQPRVVRLVIDLKQPIAPQLFTLAPVAAYQHRLVFDLYPTQERDPLLALIREKEAAEQQAARRRCRTRWASSSAASTSRRCRRRRPRGRRSRRRAAAADRRRRRRPSRRRRRAAARIDRLIIVALDPGHGGEDPGAIGPSGLREKDVVLPIALQLRDRSTPLPGMRAMLTRDADFFVPLHERVRKARRVQADLFVSIHADAFFTPAGARRLGVRAQPGRRQQRRGALDGRQGERRRPGGRRQRRRPRTRSVMRALLDMSTTAQIKDSLKLGSEVLGQHRPGRPAAQAQRRAGRLRGAEGARHPVASWSRRPSSPTRKKKPSCATRDYQAQLVDALATGIRRYFARTRRWRGSGSAVSAAGPSAGSAPSRRRAARRRRAPSGRASGSSPR